MKKLVFLFALLIVGVASASPGVVSTTQNSATVEGLDCGTKYRFEIRKYTATGDVSSTADHVDAQTKDCPDTQPPSAPQNLMATGATQTSISVSWSASTDNVGVGGYHLYRAGAKVDSTTATSYTFGGLSCGTSHTLAVEAHDAAGNRSAASAITASTAACAPASCPSGEYSAQYYGNMTLSGTPALQRCETAINHGWGSGSPGPAVPADRFSARWTGTFSFAAGSYQFTATADDGIRVWVDGIPLIDSWKDQAPTAYQATRTLTAGVHAVKVEYYENGGGAVARVGWQLSQLPMPPPVPASPGPEVGAQFHAIWDFQTDASRIAVLDKLKAARIQWVRIDVAWGGIESASKGSRNLWYLAKVDHAIGQAHARGIKVLVMLWWTPPWANGNRSVYAPPNNPQDYADFARWMAERYAGKVQAYEVWNEPDPAQTFWQGTQQQYVDLIRAAYPAFHAGDPRTRVVLGGPTWNNDRWIRGLYNLGVKGSFDVLATHPYQGKADEPPEHADDGNPWWFTHLPAVRKVQSDFADLKPIWFTEFGWSQHANAANEPNWSRGVTAQQQADYAIRALNYTKANYPYVEVAFWYKEQPRPGGTDVHQEGFGLMNADLSARPVYTALSNR
jgi:polysaccharide biosynthesis protein PslG